MTVVDTAALLAALESADLSLPEKLHAAGAAVDARLEPAAMNRVIAVLTALRSTSLAPHHAVTVSLLLGEALRAAGQAEAGFDTLTDALGALREVDPGIRDLVVQRFTRNALALRRGEEALRRLRESLGDAIPAAQPALELSRIMASLGRLDEAVTVLTRTIEAGRTAGPEAAELVRQRGVLLERQGETTAAVADFTAGNRLMPADAPPDERALASASLSTTLHNAGRPDEAAQAADRALELARAGGSPHALGAALTARGNVCLGSGQTRLALHHYHQALLEFATVGTRDHEVVLLNNIAHCYLGLGQLHLHAKYLGWALDSAEELDDRENRPLALLNMSVASSPREARGLITEAWGLYAERGDRQGQALALCRLAQVLQWQDQHADSLHFFGMAADIGRTIGDSRAIAVIHGEMGDLSVSLGRPDSAWDHYEQSWAAHETMRRLTFAESVQLDMSAETQSCVAGAMQLALAQESAVEGSGARDGTSGPAASALWRSRLFTVLERSRARVLVDRLGSTPTASAALPVHVRDRLAGLAEQVRTRQHLLQAHRSGDGDGTEAEPERLERLTSDLRRARAEFDEFEAFAAQSFPTYRSFTTVDPGDESAFDAAMGERVAVVEYAAVGEELISLVRNRGRLSVHRHGSLAEAAALDQELAGLCWDSPDTGRITELSRRLHTQLLEPVERAGALAGAGELIVVPTPKVFEFPVEALLGADGYAFEKYAVTYLPSLSVSRFLRALPSSYEPALIMANPDGTLRRAEEEVEAIRRQLRNITAGGPLVGGTATKKAFTRWAPSARLVHLAAHTDLQPDAPAFSSIVLASEGPDGTGHLEVRDLLPLRLEPCLTVLSGCGTGRGSEAGTDEMIGFVRAFLAGGSCAVLATRWPVRDRPTSLFMHTFYEGLIQDALHPLEALNRARDHLRAQGPFRHPAFWAPFTYFGLPPGWKARAGTDRRTVPE
ncbi:CHAT domain-containing protein [Streptomyces sp. SLBN-8D4]|uniref:CHAT domain-containing protein n=1 Tax=Streptomyces sp. SLBN-8D4 TaxID=3377728 RepID=UPI003C7D6A77